MPGEAVVRLSIHGSSATVNHPVGSLENSVKEIIHDSRGTIIKQMGGGNHFYNGMLIDFPLLLSGTSMEFDFDHRPRAIGIILQFKATEGTWIEWVHLHNGQDIVQNFAFGSKYVGKGTALDQSPIITIWQNFQQTSIQRGVVAFFPVGFPEGRVGEVCLINASLLLTPLGT